MELPQWLDTLIFDKLKGQYRPRYSDMTNIDDDNGKTLNYLGTYFPRSYAEAYCIFSDYLQQHVTEFDQKEEISLFDFGCGTGGEIIGLLMALNNNRRELKKIQINCLDGNQHSLRMLERILNETQDHLKFHIENRYTPIHIDDFYDLHVLDDVISNKYDIIVSFKAICEFVTKDQFERQNAYEHIAGFLKPKLKSNGVMLFVDVTTYNDTSQDWLPKMMDKGLRNAGCKVIAKNERYNETYIITHSRKNNDISKVAWRIIK